jgi:hypothetical protein
MKADTQLYYLYINSARIRSGIEQEVLPSCYDLAFVPLLFVDVCAIRYMAQAGTGLFPREGKAQTELRLARVTPTPQSDPVRHGS